MIFIFPSKAQNPTNDKIGKTDSDEEDKDTIGETRFIKPIKAIRSLSILHSAEDLSTDSTFVYKSRSGYDSNRSSRRRAHDKNLKMFNADELKKDGQNIRSANESPAQPFGRGLSKSMTIPTPVSDFSKYWDNTTIKANKTFCDKIKR